MTRQAVDARRCTCRRGLTALSSFGVRPTGLATGGARGDNTSGDMLEADTFPIVCPLTTAGAQQAKHNLRRLVITEHRDERIWRARDRMQIVRLECTGDLAPRNEGK